jgi:hypothetical protein
MALDPSQRRPDLRAGDADREAVIEFLRAHVADGRLSMEEFEDRVALVWMARTFGDLDRITDDLPAPAAASSPPRPRAGPPVRHRSSPEVESMGKVVGTFGVISVFLILIWLLAGAGYFWPIWPMLGFGLVIGLKAVNSPPR